MKKQDMEKFMVSRYFKLKSLTDLVIKRIKNLYYAATGVDGTDESVQDLSRVAVLNLRKSGCYPENTKFDIEYMLDEFHRLRGADYELYVMFTALFGKTIFESEFYTNNNCRLGSA